MTQLPYPGPPPQGPPPWFHALWQSFSRVALFAVGTVLVFLPDGTDIQVTLGGAMMMASAGLALAKGLK